MPLWTSPEREHDPLPRSLFYFVAAVTAVSLVLHATFLGLTPRTIWQGASLGAATSLALYAAWNHVLWRVPGLGLGRPQVWGTWKGELEAHYRSDDKPGTVTARLPVYAVVRQSATNASYEQLHDQSRSHTLQSKMVRRDGKWHLVGVYQNVPNDPELQQHRGSFSILLSNQELEGAYWNERWSKGVLRFTRRQPGFAATMSDARRLFGDPPPVHNATGDDA